MALMEKYLTLNNKIYFKIYKLKPFTEKRKYINKINQKLYIIDNLDFINKL